MKVKTYRGKTLQDAIQKVKTELGEDAVILNTRSVTERKALGLIKREAWEMTAAASERPAASVETPETPPKSAGAPAAAAASRPKGSILGLGAAAAPALARDVDRVEDQVKLSPNVSAGAVNATKTAKVDAPEPPKPARSRTDAHLEELLEDVAELKKSLRLIGGSLPPEVRGLGGNLYAELVGHGIFPDLAERLIAEAYSKNASDKQARDRLRAKLAEQIRVDPPRELQPKSQRVVMFVGANGVGKTTVVAKIAGHATAKGGKKVAVVCTDTSRVGAYEQLSRLGDLLEVPTYAASSAEQLTARIAGLGGYDLILIDTPGVSPSDLVRLKRLEELALAADARVHLVLSATTKSEDVAKTVKRFHGFAPGLTVFTHMDETESPGSIVAEALKHDLTVTYMTDGPRVPADLRIPSSEELARHVLPAAYAKLVS